MTYEARCKAALTAIEEIPELKECLSELALSVKVPPVYWTTLTIAEHFMAQRTRHQQELAALSAEALEDISEWGDYASEYFKEKYHFDICSAKWDARAQNNAHHPGMRKPGELASEGIDGSNAAHAGQVQVANPAVGVPVPANWLDRLRVATNAECECGGKGPTDPGVCAACQLWHFVYSGVQNTARQDNKAVAASSGAAVSSPSSGALPSTSGPDGAVPDAYAVRLGDLWWVGIYNDEETAELVAAKQPTCSVIPMLKLSRQTGSDK